MQLWRYGKPIESLSEGRYSLEGMLGNGGMAEVWKAYDDVEMRDVAIKILSPELYNDREMMSRFVKEAGQIVGWQHPHILKIYDHVQIERLGEGQFIFYIVMEYANGGDLQNRLTPGKPYPLRATFTIMRQLCDAVAYAHKHGIIHRDIKPPNVLFRQPRTGPEEVVLSDFGLAVQVDASHHTFAQAGTPAYMAPEQFQGQSEPASDIFALGVILYQLCTGELPFRRSMQTFFQDIEQEAPPPPPSTINPALPRKLDSVILCALELEPEDRYRSAQEFWKTIALALRQDILPSEKNSSRLIPPTTRRSVRSTKKILPDEAIGPAPKRTPQTMRTVPPPQPLRIAQLDKNSVAEKKTLPPHVPSLSNLQEQSLFSTRQTGEGSSKRVSRRLVIGGGAAAIAAIGGGALLFSHILMSPQPITKVTPTVPGNGHTPPPTSTPSPSPTQAQSTAPISSAVPDYTYHGHNKLVSSVAWSSDGTRIASSDWGHPATVQVWDATTGQHNLKYTVQNGSGVSSVTWSPDKTRVAWSATDNNVTVWTPTTGHIVAFPTLTSGVPNAVAWSPKGTRIAAGLSSGSVKVWNPDTGGDVLFLNGHTGEVHSVAWSPDGSKIASGSWDKTVRVWNASNGQIIYIYRGHTAVISSLSWSPDGKRIVSGSGGGEVQAWDATTGQNVVVHQDLFGGVGIVSWSPKQSRWIASDNYDTSSAHPFIIEVWDATTGKTAATYRGLTQQAAALAWSPDGQLLAEANSTSIQIWTPFR